MNNREIWKFLSTIRHILSLSLSLSQIYSGFRIAVSSKKTKKEKKGKERDGKIKRNAK